MGYIKGSFKSLFIVLVILTMFIPATAAGWQRDRPVTPYGDFCRRCTRYGVCPRMLSIKEAVEALEAYYGKKNLKAVIRSTEGRFVIAEILEDGRVVDRIIFDRKTGRVRSIY
jgi:hypothetical protein